MAIVIADTQIAQYTLTVEKVGRCAQENLKFKEISIENF